MNANLDQLLAAREAAGCTYVRIDDVRQALRSDRLCLDQADKVGDHEPEECTLDRGHDGWHTDGVVQWCHGPAPEIKP